VDDPLAGETINGGEYYPANFDKPNILSLVGNYRFTQRFSVSLTSIYSTGRPLTMPVGTFNMGGAPRVLYSERNEFRIPDFFRTDLSMTLEGSHNLKQKFHTSWTVGVYNLTGRTTLIRYTLFWKMVRSTGTSFRSLPYLFHSFHLTFVFSEKVDHHIIACIFFVSLQKALCAAFFRGQ